MKLDGSLLAGVDILHQKGWRRAFRAIKPELTNSLAELINRVIRDYIPAPDFFHEFCLQLNAWHRSCRALLAVAMWQKVFDVS